MRMEQKRREKGSFLLEFALVAPVLVVLLAGTVDVGMSLNRALVASQVCRNANVLMVRGLDLSTTQNQKLLMRTAAGLGINSTGTWNPNPAGNGVIFLTKVLRVGPLECSVGISNWNGTPGTCPNYGQYVIATRITIGNGSRWQSKTGNPATALQPNGNLSDSDIASNTGNITPQFPGIIALDLDQYTFVSEVFADTSAYQLFSITQTPLIYVRNLS